MAVAVDLSKTFDSINHNLLLQKLKAYGLSQSALSLMSSYPLGCKQRVCLHGVCSSYSELRAGLPLGSLLGPLLFNIFIMTWITRSETCLWNYVCIRCLAHCPAICFESWSQPPVGIVRCKLFVNEQCQDTSPSDQSLQVRFWLNFEWFGVTALPSIRILGVDIDSMLNFKEHISSQLKRAYAKTSALRRIMRFVPVDVMLPIYKSFILPHLEYCSPLPFRGGESSGQ